MSRNWQNLVVSEKNTNEMVTDRLIFGINSKSLQYKLIKEGNPNLDQTIEMCMIDEKISQQSKEIQNDKEREINFVKKKPFIKEYTSSKSTTNTCTFCKTKHQRGKCPAYGKTCNNCKKKNHFSVACRSKNVREVDYKSGEDEDDYYVDESKVSSGKYWMEKLRINGVCDVGFKLDSGAEVNIKNLILC